MIPGRSPIRGAAGAVPLPGLGLLVALLGTGPVGMALSDGGARPAATTGPSLDAIARRAGCRLSEFDHDPRSNPPVSGRVDERVTARDGSHVGRRPPSTPAATHAPLHGRVAVQYRRSLPRTQIPRLDEMVRRHPAGMLLFANETGMPQPVAATAYLTCPRVDARTIGALPAFRARRADYGQDF